MDAPGSAGGPVPRSPNAGDGVWQNAIESTPNAVIVADRTVRIALANRQAESLFGYEPFL
ncbi:MAG: PAS domain-containing protein [Bauldia sp.]|nr:PAS domain-containing protein [Bauldia sp.]